jgi:aspartate/methionine/tyrosine aminotransferase
VFSHRLQWDLPRNPLSTLHEEKRRAGARILDLTESNPTQAGFDYPEREILAALADPKGMRYDPAPRGLASAREAVANYYWQRGRDVAPSNILLTASTSEAYGYLFKLLADPGDEILTPRPSYPLFEFLAGLESVRVRQYPLRYDGGWHIDFDELERAITPRTRAIVVVNPNNPTGSFLKPEESERLQDLAWERGIAILMDEVFLDYGFRSAEKLAPPRGLTFWMSGLSKIAGLPQMKLGWIVAGGEGHEAALERLELIADTFLSVATPVQVALPALLALSEGPREQIRQRTQINRAWMTAARAGSEFQLLNTEGGWSGILQVPRIRGEEEWALMALGLHDVLVQPGFFFDFESEAFLVISLLTRSDVLEEGFKRLLAMI